MNVVDSIKDSTVEALEKLYNHTVKSDDVNLTGTRKEFEGDYTIVVFPYTRVAKKKPEQIGEELGEMIKEINPNVVGYNVIKGFLNLEVSNEYWNAFLQKLSKETQYGVCPSNGKTVLVEYSSPNTNKPLHLGHIRNILLGWSCAKILEANGYNVIKTQIVNDRGIAVCRSMLAWQKFGNNETPQSSGLKGDHFVGKYYVKFASAFKEEYANWQKTPEAELVYNRENTKDQSPEDFFKKYKDQYFNKHSELGKEAKEMLRKWEANDSEVRSLWGKMNAWVYDGFKDTYATLGVSFDKNYYESDTYLLGKDMIQKGIETGVFQQEDKRILANLEDVKLGIKTVIKSDGTSTYTSQDIGTARLRYDDYAMEKVVYVVGDEQINHFQVLFEILRRLGEPYAEGLYNLAYGMVDLPTGKMKSREGTVVDADELVAEVINEAKNNSKERGEIIDKATDEQEEIYRKIGMAALKYFILKVGPKKRMVFDPKESVDLQGDTGPYIQNAFVRTKGVLRKVGETDWSLVNNYLDLKPLERTILAMLHDYPVQLKAAGDHYEPSIIANYCYELAKAYHRFYHEFRIIKAESPQAKAFRIQLSVVVGNVLESGMNLLGIEMPERM